MFFCLLLIPHATLANRCACAQITHYRDCMQTGCKWANGQCSSYTCAERTNEMLCDDTPGCSWNKDSECKPFSKCADYATFFQAQCYQKGDKAEHFCQPGKLNSDGRYQCEEANYMGLSQSTIVCTQQLSEDKCSGYQKDGKKCIWKTATYPQSCVAVAIRDCNDVDGTSQKECNAMKCTWKEDQKQCNKKACADLKSRQSCLYIRDFGQAVYQYCRWEGNECKDQDSFGELKQWNCNLHTQGTHFWNGQVCQSCHSLKLVTSLLLIFAWVL